MYEVELTKGAYKDLQRIRRGDRTAHTRILEAVSELQRDPRPPGYRPLTATADSCRIRVGKYRVIYRIQQETLVISIFRVGVRGDVYK